MTKVTIARTILGIVWLVALYPGVLAVASLFDATDLPWSFGGLLDKGLPLLTLAWLIAVPVGIVCSLRRIHVGRLLLTFAAAVCMAVGVVVAGAVTLHNDYYWTAVSAALVGIVVVVMGFCTITLARNPK